MAVKLRLRREGAKKQPHYRVVVADARSPRDGRFIEIIGEYHPTENPSRVEIDEERALHWLQNGAQPTSPVKTLLRITGIWEQFKPGDEPKRDRSSREAEKAAKKKTAEPETPAEAEVEPTREADEPSAASDAEPAADTEAAPDVAAKADEPAAEADEPAEEPAVDAEADEAEAKDAGESPDTTDETDEEEQA